MESTQRAEVDDAQAALTAARLLSVMLSGDETARHLLLALPRVFPWLRFLPEAAVREFADEFAETALASAELGNMAPLTPVIEAWRATAEIHADPSLHAALIKPLDGTDHGAVPELDASAG